MPTSLQAKKYYNFTLHIDDEYDCAHLKVGYGHYFGKCSLDKSRRRRDCGKRCCNFKPSFKSRFRAAMDIIHWRNIRKVI